jgi:hypothetical protein
LALALALLGLALASPALAQQQAPAAQSGAEPSAAAKPPRPPVGTAAQRAAKVSGPVIDESFSIRKDEDLYQLEEATALIAGSLSKISDQVGTLAINSFYFGKEVDPDFRRKAEVIILEKVFAANPDVRLVQCQECQKLETKIVGGVLKLRKGIPNADARRELAKKLGADGFIDIGMFQDGKQLTVYLKVIDAESGAIILVDELVGRQAAKRQSLTFSFGELNFPIATNGKKVVTHNALALTVTETMQLTGRFSFGVDLAIWADNNEQNPDPHVTLASGIMLAPTLNYDVLQLPASTSRVILYLGLGKLIAPQLNYANFWRAGTQFVVGDRLVLVFGVNSFTKNNIVLTDSEKTDLGITEAPLSGVGYEIRFGYRF